MVFIKFVVEENPENSYTHKNYQLYQNTYKITKKTHKAIPHKPAGFRSKVPQFGSNLAWGGPK